MALLLLVFLIPLFLRIASIDHGLPRHYTRDAEFPHSALGMLSDRDPWPPQFKYTRNPYLLSYLMVPVFGVQYVVGSIAGDWSGTDGYTEHLLEYPTSERLPGRYLIAVFGALSVWVALRIARTAGLGIGAWVAAWMVATSLLHTHLSMQERNWVPMAFFFGLTIWASAVYLRDGKSRPFFLSCLFAGLAHASMAMPMGRVVLGICGLAWILGSPGWRGCDLLARAKLALVGLTIFNVVHLTLGSPFLWRHGVDPVPLTLARELGLSAWTFFFQGEFLFGGRGIFSTARWESLRVLGWAFVGHDPSLVLLGVPGLIVACKRRMLWPGIFFTVCWMGSLLQHRNGHATDASPLTFLLAIPAGFMAERLVKTRVHWVLPILLAVPLIQQGRYVLVMSRPDTRELAEMRLAELAPGDAVFVDQFGPAAELTLEALQRIEQVRERTRTGALAGERGQGLSGRESHRLARLSRGELPSGTAGLELLPAEELFTIDRIASPLAGVAARRQRSRGLRSKLAGGDGHYRVWSAGEPLDLEWPEGEYELLEGLEEYGATAAAVMESLGVRYLLLSEFNPSSGEEHALAPLTGGRPPVWVVDPGPAGAELREARLPLEMEFAATHIWQVERAGPRLALYDLRPR